MHVAPSCIAHTPLCILLSGCLSQGNLRVVRKLKGNAHLYQTHGRKGKACMSLLAQEVGRRPTHVSWVSVVWGNVCRSCNPHQASQQEGAQGVGREGTGMDTCRDRGPQRWRPPETLPRSEGWSRRCWWIRSTQSRLPTSQSDNEKRNATISKPCG